MKIKIIGAGSIGNHMAYASRCLSFDTTVEDISYDALSRMRNDIYPSRYGKWDKRINLTISKKKDEVKYDIVVIGTPPDTHYNILKKILKGNPSAVLIEKPLCKPTNKEINFFKNHLLNYKIKFFCGYNHTIGKAALKIRKLLQKKDVGKIISIDVDWREHWQGIFKAHPWLNGPSDTYLGFWKRGGGALSEHSHGINIWQFLANSQSVSKIYSINSNISYKKLNKSNYDDIAFINLKSSNNIMGRVVQDVVTLPVKKNARILTQNAYLEWHCERSKGFDEVLFKPHNKKEKIYYFKKTRADDFILELKHLKEVLENKTYINSPLNIKNAIETMDVIYSSHKSSKTKKNIIIPK